MKGIEFAVDDAGQRKAVLIDLAEHGESWDPGDPKCNPATWSW
jgi:hypothetical protein